MKNTIWRRLSAMAAAIAVAAISLLPLAATPAFAAVVYTGTASGDAWVDSTLDYMTKDAAYSSTLTLPSSNGPWDNLAAHDLPAGLSMNRAGDLVTISGTPTVGGTVDDFYFDADGGDGAHTTLTFSEVYIDPGLPASSIAIVTNVEASPYTGVNVTATVSGATPTGTVAFAVVGGASLGSVAMVGGVATYTGAVSETHVGQTIAISATYSGDAGNAASATSESASVYIFRSSTVSGTVTRNGLARTTTVELENVTGSPTIVQATTSTDGNYSFTVDGIDTIAEATHEYYIRAEAYILNAYYGTTGGPGVPNLDRDSATATSPTTWGPGFTIYDNVPPVWNDTTLATPRVDSAYSDFVTARAGSAPVTYSIVAGGLPAGLTLNTTTGEISGTPSSQTTKTFTIRADNGYGTVDNEFSLTPGAPGVAPTWTETEIADLTVGEVLADSVTAAGDPTIVYSVSTGELPTGLALNTATGAITGTPTVAGEFDFVLTATNAFGHVDQSYDVTVAAAPELDLELNFAPGTSIDDAATEISADGLKVGSTYTLYLHSTPILLYSDIVDSTGGFTWLVNLPANTPVGAHELILTGIAPNGDTLTAHAWFTLLSNGTIGAISYSGPLYLALAFTGTEPLVPLGIASLLLLGGYLAIRRGHGIRAVRVPSL